MSSSSSNYRRLKLQGTREAEKRDPGNEVGSEIYGFLTEAIIGSWGPFLESPDNFSGPENNFMCAMFALKTPILLVLKAEQ